MATLKTGKSRNSLTLVATQMRFDKTGLAKIDRAAELCGTTRSEFVRRSAVVEAEKVLIDQAYFGVDSKTLEFFNEVLSKAPSGSGFERLMGASSPWDKPEAGR